MFLASISTLGRKWRWPILLALTAGAYLSALFWHSLSMRPDGLYGGHALMWGDWALHLSLATIFADKPPGEWFAYHPVFADGRLTYAFLANLISAMLMRAGLPLTASFILPSIVTGLIMLAGLFALWRRVLGSEPAAFVACWLPFLTAGTGFTQFLANARQKGLSLAWSERLDQFTTLPGGWNTSNLVNGQFFPQRAMLLGLAISLWAVYGLIRGTDPEPVRPRNPQRALLASGLAIGVLPIAHMHSLMTLMIVLLPVLLFRIRLWRLWLWFVVPAGALSSALYLLFVHGGIQTSGFMGWLPGAFAHQQGFGGWLHFWFKAWGILVPAAIAGAIALWKPLGSAGRGLAAGFALAFVFANLVRTQPILWDNTKMLAWVAIGASGLAAGLLLWLWRRGSAARAAAALIAIVLGASGALECVELARFERHRIHMLSNEELALAELVRTRTPSQARFATAPIHNHWVAMRGGRAVLLGFPGWAYNFGFDFAPVERDLRLIFEGAPSAMELLRKRRVDFVVVGPNERGRYKISEEFFRKNLFLVVDSPEIKLYALKPTEL